MPLRSPFRTPACLALMVTLIFAPLHWSPSRAAAISTALKQLPEQRSVIVVMGLANSINNDVRRAIETELDGTSMHIIDLTDQPLSSADMPDQGLIVAAGVAGCEQTIALQVPLEVRCVLLTEESFQAIVSNAPSPVSRSLSALVIDQPLTRQAQVAQRVYPALSRFAVLSETSSVNSIDDQDDFSLRFNHYRPALPLAAQLTEALAGNDALIAIPETAIYSRSTLRTVLLTAYGYGKPVVGLSRAYVKAGALISTYSTPNQIFREVAETLISETSVPLAAVSYPRYFSVVDNINVAKSLRLTRQLRFDLDTTFTDRDFQP